MRNKYSVNIRTGRDQTAATAHQTASEIMHASVGRGEANPERVSVAVVVEAEAPSPDRGKQTMILVLESVRNTFQQTYNDLEECLHNAIQDANAQIQVEALTHPQAQGMAASIILAGVWNDSLYWARVGRGRIWRKRDGGPVEPLDEGDDRTSGQRLGRLLQISPDGAPNSIQRKDMFLLTAGDIAPSDANALLSKALGREDSARDQGSVAVLAVNDTWRPRQLMGIGALIIALIFVIFLGSWLAFGSDIDFGGGIIPPIEGESAAATVATPTTENGTDTQPVTDPATPVGTPPTRVAADQTATAFVVGATETTEAATSIAIADAAAQQTAVAVEARALSSTPIPEVVLAETAVVNSETPPAEIAQTDDTGITTDATGAPDATASITATIDPVALELTATALPIPEPLNPQPGLTVNIGDPVTFRWRWSGELAENWGFEIKVQAEDGWKGIYDANATVRTADSQGIYSQLIDFPGGLGPEEVWAIAVVQRKTEQTSYRELTRSTGQRLVIGGSGAGSSDRSTVCLLDNC